MNSSVIAAIEGWFFRAADRARSDEGWRVARTYGLTVLALVAVAMTLLCTAGLALVAVALLCTIPVGEALTVLLVFLLIIAVPLTLVRAWLREFRFLMQLGDESFPGRFDKPIWVALMATIPPVGVYLFRTYRRATWPDASKPAGSYGELA